MVSLSMNHFISSFFLIFTLVWHVLIIIPVNSYNFTENFRIDCGSSYNSTLVDHHNWIGDINSEHFSLFEPQENHSSIFTTVSNQIPYETARLSHYEFTYSFPITTGTKLLRLHFHSASYLNVNLSESLFSVKAGPYTLLNNFNASLVADEHGDPKKSNFHKEFYINVDDHVQRLNVTFTPNFTSHKNSYAFINGIELLSSFKPDLNFIEQNDSRSKFVGMIHEANSNHRPFVPRLSPGGQDPCSKMSKKPLRAVLFSAICTIISVSFIYLLCLWIRKMVRTKKNKTEMEMETLSEEISSKNKSISPSGSCRYFSIIEIRAATINFDDIFVVGVGGFGKVYKGYIDDDCKPVAIKRFIPNSLQGVQEFKTEVEMLSQLSHPHLVSLIGYCNDEDDMIIVYDLMANGTLRDHLYGSTNNPLSWKQRLEICIGAGLGLEYLHNGAKYSNIIHRDVKSSNILLDEKWVAKISDFGLSKMGPDGVSKFHVSTQVKGSLGYLDPEYSKTKRLTHKSDVYSFGVVLLEVLCGRPPLLRKVEGSKRSLVEWAHTCHSEGGPQGMGTMVDPFLKGTILPECLDKFVEMALKCVVRDGDERPSISEVVKGLELALQLQLSKEEGPRFSLMAREDQEF